MVEIDVAVFTFDAGGQLRLVNRAGERLLDRPADRLLGTSAADLSLAGFLEGTSPRIEDASFPGGRARWEVRRTTFRQEGRPHHLLVLADVSRPLRDEERQAWQRLIRVIGHEINNSLAPIKSISGSLRSLLSRRPSPADLGEDVERGLQVIEGRAEALGRFMASYAQLARLPQPQLRPVEVDGLVRRVAALETRVPVEVLGGPQLNVQADADQLEQLLINLVRNAADATLEERGGTVQVRWRIRAGRLHLLVEDEGRGLGDTANLFVPFYTTKPGGSGIGLVLSRQIAEGHGGTLELENRPRGRGARARVVLPLYAET
jgi:nitrogen fixation/metabolism regulation signal transduction histidine kinase